MTALEKSGHWADQGGIGEKLSPYKGQWRMG